MRASSITSPPPLPRESDRVALYCCCFFPARNLLAMSRTLPEAELELVLVRHRRRSLRSQIPQNGNKKPPKTRTTTRPWSSPRYQPLVRARQEAPPDLRLAAAQREGLASAESLFSVGCWRRDSRLRVLSATGVEAEGGLGR